MSLAELAETTGVSQRAIEERCSKDKWVAARAEKQRKAARAIEKRLDDVLAARAVETVDSLTIFQTQVAKLLKALPGALQRKLTEWLDAADKAQAAGKPLPDAPFSAGEVNALVHSALRGFQCVQGIRGKPQVRADVTFGACGDDSIMLTDELADALIADDPEMAELFDDGGDE